MKPGQLGGLVSAHRLGPEGVREQRRLAGRANARRYGDSPQAIRVAMQHLRARRQYREEGRLDEWQRLEAHYRDLFKTTRRADQ